jgi:hypothetical protein
MESQIWRVQTEKIGSLEPFKSERDMESFLMNNPAIVGCWNPESAIAMPTLMRQQINLKSPKGEVGRMDLVGLSLVEGGRELRIFELKANDIDVAAVEQIKWYLDLWKENDAVKLEMRRWILSFGLDNLDEVGADKIVEDPVAVLVGPKFQPEAIAKAVDTNIQGIRLARFKSETKSEYFVVVEDQVGKIVESGRLQWRWKDLIDSKLMEASDIFSISHNKITLSAKPDPKYLDYYWKYLIYDEESARRLLEKEKDIRANAGSYKKEWLDKDFESLRKGGGIVITRASALFYFAFGGPYPSCYWNPIWMWIHKKSGKELGVLVNEFAK